MSDLEAENRWLREALKPFALRALVRNPDTVSDDREVVVTMDECRKALRAYVDTGDVHVTMGECRAALLAMNRVE